MKYPILAGLLALAGSLLATALPVAAASLPLTGRLVDAASGLPLEYATVSAYAPDSTLVDGTVTDSTGAFQLVLPQGDYRLRLEFIGYAVRDTLVSLHGALELGTIQLGSDAVALDEATVTAGRSQLSLKLDKRIFDVGTDLVSQGGSANEVLGNVPAVTVSPEGVVSLRGNASVKVLINGKPSTMADNNALQGIPAANIARVEVVTNPSSRYQAAGSAGIINIVLKEATVDNAGGQVSVSVGYPADYRLNGSFSVSKSKLTYFGNAGYRYSNYFSTGSAERLSQLPGGTQRLSEDLDQDRNDRAWNGFGGFDFRPTARTTVSASYSFYHQTNDDISRVDYRYRDGAGDLLRDWRQTYTFLEPENYHQIEAALTQELAREDQSLTILFQNDFWDNDERELTVIDERFPSGTEALRVRTNNLESSRDYLLQADYEQPFGKTGTLELGVRGETRLISSDYLAEQRKGEIWSAYLGLDNVLDYRERIGAAYAQVGLERGAWGVQLGLRDEFTFVSVEDELATPRIEKRYNRLFPSATLSYKLTEAASLSASYSKRIRRPGFWQLNPFAGLENPNEVRLGNPDLDPSFTDAVEVKALWKSEQLTLNPSVFASRARGYFETLVQQDETGRVTLFPINLEREDILGAELLLTYAPTDDWQLTAETRYGYFRQQGVFADLDFANTNSTLWASVSARGGLPLGVKAQARFEYRGPRRYAQEYSEANYNLGGGVSRKFLGDRLQATLNVRNAFGWWVFRGGSQRATFTNSYTRVWQGQRVQLTVAWEIRGGGEAREARNSIR